VLGSEAELDLVAQLIGVDTVATASERLRTAVPAGLVEMGPTDTRVRFAHALVRDAAYAALAPSRRARLHRLAAELLEPRATGRDELAGAVARHWDRGGEPGLAVAWAVRAADSARAAGAYEEAASYVEFALEATGRTGTGPVVDRAELLLDLARMQYLGGHIGASVRSCRDAAAEGERTGQAEVVARAAIMVQGFGGPDTNTHITQLCQRALAMLDAAAPSDLRATVEAQLACALTELDLADEAEPWSRRALEDASASGDANAELDAIRARVMLTWRSSDDDEVFALGGRAIELAGPTRRPLARLWAHTWRSDVAFRRADMAALRVEMLEMQRLADQTGLPVVRWHLLRQQASLAALTGDFDGCRQLGRQAVAVAESWQDLSVRYTHVGQTACLALLRGDPSDVDPQWTEWVSGIGQQPPIARALIAAVLHLVGREDEARTLYETLVATLASVRTPQQAAVLSYLVPLAIAYGDVASCLAIRDFLATSYSGSPAIGSGTVFYFGSVARMLGRLSLAANEPAVAIEQFEEGIRVDATIGARPGVAEGRLGLAKALCATGEVTRGLELGRTAAAEARRLDMPGVLRQADAFLTEAAAKARTEDNLTDREREVVALVAQALSNRDIAASLVLSERTVESHVRNILAKTGLATRTELVRWYLQRPA
jgi:DNA-binding CsgD family transcriptional regulator